jgi:hypothetical protein
VNDLVDFGKYLEWCSLFDAREVGLGVVLKFELPTNYASTTITNNKLQRHVTCTLTNTYNNIRALKLTRTL